MSCNHCTQSVGNALRSVPGVERVEVTLPDSAEVVADAHGHGPTIAALLAAVQSAGYEARWQEQVTYHVRWDAAQPAKVFGLVRLRQTPSEFIREVYRPDRGWVQDHRAIDAGFDRQDYETVDETEALRLAAAMEESGA
jgi:copper chaperone CopZ